MFRLYTSNDATRLATELGAHLGAPSANPLTPARVLVPQPGLARWLQGQLAEHLGVIANVQFCPPARFAWELLHAAHPDLPERSPFDVAVLRWHVYALLASLPDAPALAPLTQYLATGGDPLRRFALSLELARVYERMQGYRRRKLLAWEHGEAPDNWQAALWRLLRTRVGGTSRAALVDAWLAAYDPEYAGAANAHKPAPPGLPARLACFACTNVSPDVLRMLAIVGLHRDLDFYLPLPAGEYLGDTPTRRSEVWQRLRERDAGNPIVLANGGALAEFVELLYGYQQVQPDEEIDAFDTTTDRNTMLGRVRGDMLQHIAPAGAAAPDDSLQFHACHTPLREVQTLHDALLALLSDERFAPPLQPRDIAVMMPDVATYRPAIDAVFGGIERSDPRWLPFNLGDASAAQLHPVAQLFSAFLDAPASRWEIDDLLDVLAAPGVLRRFDLDTDALAQLARQLRDAGVRWGEDEYARAACGGYREYSWAFGIDRLLAGFACGDAAVERVGGVVPVAGIEGTAFAHLDAVLAVTGAWRQLREAAKRPRPAAAWQAFFNRLLDDLYLPDPHDSAESRALERLRHALAQLADDCAAADPDLVLPWADVRAFLGHALAGADAQQYLFTGGITFCGMVPLRVVPFRVICLVGMDAAAFPRREASSLDPLLADRRNHQAQRGDRNVRADDRLLFLQLLAAAREVFYVSWQGRDAHTNNSQPPAVVVAELIDLVRTRYLVPLADQDARAQRDAALVQPEPLQPFDPDLFAPDPARARSFQRQWQPAANVSHGAGGTLEPFVAPAPRSVDPLPTEIQLDTLQRFLADPARGFLEQALQLRLPRDAEEDTGLEPLEPDNALLRYDLVSRLLAADNTDTAAQELLLRAQGRLPPGELANAALAIAHTRAKALGAAIADFTHGQAPLAPITARIEVDGSGITGTVAGRYPAGLVRETAGKLNGKRALKAWIDTLFASIATNAPIPCRLVWMENDGRVATRDLAPVTPADARAKLAELLAAMRTGLTAPLPLFPKASWDALKRTRIKGEAGREEFIELFRDAADPASDQPYSEFSAQAVRIAWRGVNLAAPDTELAQRLYDTALRLLPTFAAVGHKR